MIDLLAIFTSQGAAGILVDLVILVLLAVGLRDVWQAARMVSMERRQLKVARDTLLRQGAASTPEILISTLRVSTSSVLGERLGRMLKLRRAGLGYREIVQRISIDSIEGYGGHARYIATALTLLGLLGTVIGMSMAMLKMSDVFQSVNDPSKLDTLTVALSHTLDGMKTAFGCTLAGLLGALVLSSANHLLKRRQSVLVQEMEEWISCDLTPVLEQVDPEADEAARAFATVLKDATGNMKGFSVALMSAAETYTSDASQIRTLVTGFGEAMDKFGRSATEITSNQIAFTQSLKETQITIASLSGTLGTMDKTLAELKSSFAVHNSSFTKLIADTTSSMTGAFQKNLDETRKEMEQLMEQNRVQLGSFSDMMIDLHLDGRGAHAAGGRK